MTYGDEEAFRAWCATTEPVTQPGLVNLHCLPPLLRAEIQWGLHTHAQSAQRSEWTTNDIRNLVRNCWRGSITSLMDLHDEGYAVDGHVIPQVKRHVIPQAPTEGSLGVWPVDPLG
ncbi:hypothetical protein ACODT3_00320 [Streptomyces sp. 4.24]|uniref:hypothetical protein n=1 Tax=Streptomyces tritrimontium TaxID=3406573 RepID=UPI003BB4A43B